MIRRSRRADMRSRSPLSITQRRLLLESLESRQLLATVASFDNDRASAAYAIEQDGTDPPPSEVSGGVIPGGKAEFLRLYSGVPDNLNSVAFSRTDAGPIETILADFDFRLTPVNERPDGLSFSLVNTSNYGISGPVVAAGTFPQYAGSLGIAFDTFKHDEDPSGDSIKVYYDTQLVQQTDVSHLLDLAGGQWIHARISLTAGLLSLQLTPAAGGTTTVFSGLSLPGFIPFESRAVFSGRSGGAAWGNADIDNVNVQYGTAGKAVLSLKLATATVNETVGSVSLTAERSGDTSKSGYVRYATQAISALAGQDFVGVSGTLSFAAGQKSKTISIPISNDAKNEPHEQFVVALSSPSVGSVIGGRDRQTVTIVDDERARLIGDFGDVLLLPNEMIHAILLPTGEVLSFDQETGSQSGWLWNPLTGQSRPTSPSPAGGNLFCTGHTLLADGRVFIAGGHEGFDESGNPRGLCIVSIYNPFDDTWEALPDMAHCRWYPTVLALPNGDVLLMGGYDETGTNTVSRQIEIYRHDVDGWTRWDFDVSQDIDENYAAHDGLIYPRLFLAPDGRILVLGAGSQIWWLNLAAEGTPDVWTPGPATIGEYTRNDYGTATMIAPGKLLLIGGGGDREGTAPQGSVELIDLNAADPQWTALDPMPGGGRRHLNTTVLPGGDLLVSGGSNFGEFNNAAGVARQALHLRPSAPSGSQWEVWDSAASPRLYHSTTLLLPSGKVLTAGSGQPHATDSFDQRNAEVFSPTYVYQTGRPVIVSSPVSESYGLTVSVKSSATNLSQIVLMKLGAITHSLEESARRVPLTWSKGAAGTFNVQLPTNPNAAPPGHYLLFILDSRGVPSEGRMFQLLETPAALGSPLMGGASLLAGEDDSAKLNPPRAVNTPATISPKMASVAEAAPVTKRPLSESAVDHLMEHHEQAEDSLIGPLPLPGWKLKRL